MTFQKSPNLEPNQLGSSKLKKEPVNSIWSPIGSKSPNLVTLIVHENNKSFERSFSKQERFLSIQLQLCKDRCDPGTTSLQRDYHEGDEICGTQA